MSSRFFAALSVVNVLIPTLIYASGGSNASGIEAGPPLAQVEAKIATYDSVVPYYTMQCSFSKYRMDDGDQSGFLGHTVIYIKGACRDKSVPYPKLKMCDPGTDLTNPASGVGLSVEKLVSNSQYVAVDGLDFLLNGSARPNEPVTNGTLQKTIDAVIASGTLNGVKIHDVYLKDKPVNQSITEYVAWQGLGTDFAVTFGRDSTCARIPMTRTQIQAEVHYLNETNEPFVTGAEEFDWNPFADNCAHFTHDVLSAGGVRTEIPRSNSRARAIYNVASFHWEMPNNDVLLDMEFANDLSKINTPKKVYEDHDERDQFNALGTLARLGATLELLPMHLIDNSVYLSDSPETYIFDIPFVRDRARKLKSVEKSPTYENLGDNLKRVLARLQKIQAGEHDTNELIDLDPSLIGAVPLVSLTPSPASDFVDFKERYDTWIYRSILDIQGKLAKLAQLNLQ
jgi:hypothetical protein